MATAIKSWPACRTNPNKIICCDDTKDWGYESVVLSREGGSCLTHRGIWQNIWLRQQSHCTNFLTKCHSNNGSIMLSFWDMTTRRTSAANTYLALKVAGPAIKLQPRLSMKINLNIYHALLSVSGSCCHMYSVDTNIRDVQNRFFYLVRFRFAFKTHDSFWNEFGSVQFKKRGSVRIL